MFSFRSLTGGFFSTSLAVLALGLSVDLAAAQGTERIGDFGDWSAFRYKENNQTICYIASIPKKDEGDYTRRGDIFAIVTHRPSENTRNEFSLVAGYSYKDGSSVELLIGDRKWTLFTDADGAFAADAETDNAIVNAMVKGTTMKAKGTSSRGTATTDTYSLIGFTKAHKAINQACK
ncbi:MAG: invasion associated locus B family protein [Kiloniellales bacterium]|nr:invasion associated locus B family protein [Kiloniellales bacterium]